MGHQRSRVPSSVPGPARRHLGGRGPGPAAGPGRTGGGGRAGPARPLRGRLPQRRLRAGRHHGRVRPAPGRAPGQPGHPTPAAPAGRGDGPAGRGPPGRVGHLPAGRQPPRPPPLGPGGRAVPGPGHGRRLRAAAPGRPGPHLRAAGPLPGGRAVVPALLALGVAGSSPGRPTAARSGSVVVLLVVTVVLAVALPAGAERHRAGPPHPDRLRPRPAGRPAAFPLRSCHGHGPVRRRGPVAPTSRWPWPCGSPASRARSWAAPAPRGVGAEGAAAEAAAAAGAAAAGAAGERPGRRRGGPAFRRGGAHSPTAARGRDRMAG
jgi:hypothetical protein